MTQRTGYARRQEPANRKPRENLNSNNPIQSFSATERSQPKRSRILTPEGAAEHLSIDPRTATRWAREGYLPAHPLGEGKRKFWRFYEHELDAWLAARTNQREAA